jgi:hypothetical protein
MSRFEYIDEPEGPSIGFPFNVPDEFLDSEDEEENDLTVVRQILKFMGVAA